VPPPTGGVLDAACAKILTLPVVSDRELMQPLLEVDSLTVQFRDENG
jgi:hypothetical protein